MPNVAVASEPWRVAEQPDLRQALEKAPGLGAGLELERAPARLGVPMGGCVRGTPGHDFAIGRQETEILVQAAA